MRSYGIISLSLAVIEAMQRSSAKQFSSICSWQCSFETRCNREIDINNIIIKNNNIDICFNYLQSYFIISNQSNKSLEDKDKGSPKKINNKKEKTENIQNDPVDITFIIIQVIRFVYYNNNIII